MLDFLSITCLQVGEFLLNDFLLAYRPAMLILVVFNEYYTLVIFWGRVLSHIVSCLVLQGEIIFPIFPYLRQMFVIQRLSLSAPSYFHSWLICFNTHSELNHCWYINENIKIQYIDQKELQ